MLATMLALAVLEHWFLVLPVPDAALWRWAMPGDREGGESASASAPHDHHETRLVPLPVADRQLAARPHVGRRAGS